jgi:ribonuclease Z
VTAAAGNAAENAAQRKRIASNHTTPQQAGKVFTRVAPKLAVYNHLLLFGDARAEDTASRHTKKLLRTAASGRGFDVD